MSRNRISVTCEKCGKEVDFCHVQYSIEKQGYWIVVDCHGKREEMFLSDLDRPVSLRGVAFKCPSLLAISERKE